MYQPEAKIIFNSICIAQIKNHLVDIVDNFS